MRDFRQDYPGRECREFWATSSEDYEVHHVQGFDCKTESDATTTMWWVPQLGYSMSTEYHLFNTEREAIEKALSNAMEERNKVVEAIAKILGRLNMMSA